MTDTLHRLEHVKARTGLSRSTIYAQIAQGIFPSPLKLGPRSVAWLESEIQNWIEQKIADSRGSVA